MWLWKLLWIQKVDTRIQAAMASAAALAAFIAVAPGHAKASAASFGDRRPEMPKTVAIAAKQAQGFVLNVVATAATQTQDLTRPEFLRRWW
jgi:hypothetical protein